MCFYDVHGNVLSAAGPLAAAPLVQISTLIGSGEDAGGRCDLIYQQGAWAYHRLRTGVASACLPSLPACLPFHPCARAPHTHTCTHTRALVAAACASKGIACKFTLSTHILLVCPRALLLPPHPRVDRGCAAALAKLLSGPSLSPDTMPLFHAGPISEGQAQLFCRHGLRHGGLPVRLSATDFRKRLAKVGLESNLAMLRLVVKACQTEHAAEVQARVEEEQRAAARKTAAEKARAGHPCGLKATHVDHVAAAADALGVARPEDGDTLQQGVGGHPGLRVQPAAEATLIIKQRCEVSDLAKDFIISVAAPAGCADPWQICRAPVMKMCAEYDFTAVGADTRGANKQAHSHAIAAAKKALGVNVKVPSSCVAARSCWGKYRGLWLDLFNMVIRESQELKDFVLTDQELNTVLLFSVYVTDFEKANQTPMVHPKSSSKAAQARIKKLRKKKGSSHAGVVAPAAPVAAAVAAGAAGGPAAATTDVDTEESEDSCDSDYEDDRARTRSSHGLVPTIALEHSLFAHIAEVAKDDPTKIPIIVTFGAQTLWEGWVAAMSTTDNSMRYIDGQSCDSLGKILDGAISPSQAAVLGHKNRNIEKISATTAEQRLELSGPFAHLCRNPDDYTDLPEFESVNGCLKLVPGSTFRMSVGGHSGDIATAHVVRLPHPRSISGLMTEAVRSSWLSPLRHSLFPRGDSGPTPVATLHQRHLEPAFVLTTLDDNSRRAFNVSAARGRVLRQEDKGTTRKGATTACAYQVCASALAAMLTFDGSAADTLRPTIVLA